MDAIAPITDSRFTRDLMRDAVLASPTSMVVYRLMSSFGGMIRVIIEVPFPLGGVGFLKNVLVGLGPDI